MPTTNEVWTDPQTEKGTIGGASRLESPLEILTRIARNLEYTAARATEAATDAAVSRALAEASATREDALTQAEVDNIADAVGKRIAAGFDVELSPKAVL